MSRYKRRCATIIWGSAAATRLQTLITVQKKIIRLVTCSHYLAPSADLFTRYHLLRLSDLYKLQVALFVFKHKHHLLPKTCTHYLNESTSHAYNTRLISYFDLISFRTSIRERGIRVQGPRIWNEIPPHLQCMDSIATFKKQLTKYYLSYP